MKCAIRSLALIVQVDMFDLEVVAVVKSRNPEFEWRVFQSGLSKSYCSKSRIIEDILSFRADYNEYRR
jgi:hypothetical protein